MRQPREPLNTDLTDAQWQAVRELLPAPKPRGRKLSTDLREVVNAINCRRITKRTWRDLPSGFPPWATIYTIYKGWEKQGLLEQIYKAVDSHVVTD